MRQKLFHLFSMLILLCTAGNQHSKAQTLAWAGQAGGAGVERAAAIAVDKAGNSYVTGLFNGTADFDPDPFIDKELFSKGAADVFLAKYDIDGNYIWAISLGGPLGDTANAVAVDEAGNVYICGSFNGTADFDPSPDIKALEANGPNTDIFLAKYDANGAYLWAFAIGGEGSDIARGLVLDDAGNICLLGGFFAKMDVDPGPQQSMLSSNGGLDVFFAKYSPEGDFLLAKSFGGGSADYGQAIGIDRKKNIYIAGYFTGPAADFDPGADKALRASAGGNDIFLAKYTEDGAYVWAHRIGGTLDDRAQGLAIDTGDNIYITGDFRGAAGIDFNPGAGIDSLNARNNSSDAFFAKYSENGDYIWAKSIRGDEHEIATCILVSDTAIFVAGTTGSSLTYGGTDFDPGPDEVIKNSASFNTSGFVARYNHNGVYRHVNLISESNATSVMGMALNLVGNLHIAGTFSSTVDLDPGAGLRSVTSKGSSDVYVLRYRSCEDLSSVLHTTCGSFVHNGTTYTESGFFVDSFKNSNNCDSLSVLHLTLMNSVNTPVNGTFCDSVSFNGISYTSTGTYTQTYTNGYGCDSSVIYDIVINTATAAVTKDEQALNAAASGSYQWYDCNSLRIIPGATSRQFIPLTSGTYAVIVSENGCIDTSDCIQADAMGIYTLPGNKAKITVSPNPAKGMVTIQSDRPFRSAELRLFNMLGQLVHKQHHLSGTVLSVDISSMNQGVYLMSLSDEGMMQQIKITKE